MGSYWVLNMTKISNLPQDTAPTGDDFVPTLDSTQTQTRKQAEKQRIAVYLSKKRARKDIKNFFI